MTIAPPDQQLKLFDILPSWRITKNAQARNAYGSVAQDIVCATLKLKPIPINGSYQCCFDALDEAGTYYEIKSVHAGGKVVIYDWRRLKEENAKVKLNYAILMHRVRCSDGLKLAQEFTQSGLTLLVIPAQAVHEAASRCDLQQIRRGGPARMGHNRLGYRDGYRNVPTRALLEFWNTARSVPVQWSELLFKVNVLSQTPL